MVSFTSMLHATFSTSKNPSGSFVLTSENQAANRCWLEVLPMHIFGWCGYIYHFIHHEVQITPLINPFTINNPVNDSPVIVDNPDLWICLKMVSPKPNKISTESLLLFSGHKLRLNPSCRIQQACLVVDPKNATQ